MASWIIHLRVAQTLMDTLPTVGDVTAFAVGNIAPDSGAPNPDGVGYTPSKDTTHFQTVDETGVKDIRPAVFMAAYLTEEQVRRYMPRQYGFYLGYLAHLVTDQLWADEIVFPVRDANREWFRADKEGFFAYVKRDWYDLDCVYLMHHPDFPAYRAYAEAVGFRNDFLDFFPAQVFDVRRQAILEFYRQRMMTVDEHRPMHLDGARLDAFVHSTAARVAALAASVGCPATV
jgi:hypothetical protein